MWRKGREVMREYPELGDGKPQRGGRGVVEVSYVFVARETGRSDMAIARWVKLFLAHPEKAQGKGKRTDKRPLSSGGHKSKMQVLEDEENRMPGSLARLKCVRAYTFSVGRTTGR